MAVMRSPQINTQRPDGLNTAVHKAKQPPAPGADTKTPPWVALVRRARQGDRKAFGGLVGELQKPLYFAVLRITGHPQDARDIVQRAFLKAWERMGELDKDEKFRSWLFTIGMNLARNSRRDRGRRQHEPIEERTLVSPATAPDELQRAQQRQMLRQALTQLPARQRDVVTLRIDSELSFEDIGRTLDCTAATARVNFHHGMKRLRQLLSPPQGQSAGGTQ